ncbi:MAG: carbohydrate-binding domain-containing protein [Armatimonadota bacterium]
MRLSITALVILLCGQACFAAELVRVEAEDWSAQGGGDVKILANPDASAGKTVSYWEEHGVWLEVTLEISRPGDYLLSVGYALAWPESKRKVFVDGQEVGEIVLPSTTGWSIFGTATTGLRPLALQPGKHTLRFLNANSVGLSLDWVALHTADAYFADRRLTADEQQALLARWERAAPPVAERTLTLGQVQVRFDGPGRAVLAQVGEVVMATPAPEDARLAPITLHQTKNFRLAVVRGRLQQVWVTDGRNLYLVNVSERDNPVQLPAPVLAGDMRVAVGRMPEGPPLNFSVPGGEPREAKRLELGGLQVTGVAGLRVGPWQEGGIPDLWLRANELNGCFIAAAKWSARWGKDEPAIVLEQAGDQVMVQESARQFPTLAAFYGEKPFDLSLRGSTLKFVDVAGGDTIEIK